MRMRPRSYVSECRPHRFGFVPGPNHLALERLTSEEPLRLPNVVIFSLLDFDDSEFTTRARHQSRPADPLRALPRSHGHYRHQNEVLRRLLCLQGLPRGARRSSDRSLAGKRMESESNTLRRLRHGANHQPVPGLRFALPNLQRAFQPRLPKSLSFLFRRRQQFVALWGLDLHLRSARNFSSAELSSNQDRA